MAVPLITEIEKAQMKESVTPCRVGDTVRVATTIVEGKKQRVQNFEGIVIGIQKAFSRKSVTVRKLVDSVGVEKTFLVHSPLFVDLKVIKEGKPRRARLTYLRDRLGAKATRVKARDTEK